MSRQAAVVTKISPTGRLTLPSSLRKQTGLSSGSEVILDVIDGELRVRTVDQVMSRARALAKRLTVDAQGSLVDELIAERRAAAERGE